MITNIETLQRLAHLARLEFDEKTENEMLSDINNLLTWVEQLNAVDTTGVEPLIHLSHEVNVMREDEVKEHLSKEKGLLNAPKKDSDYFRSAKSIRLKITKPSLILMALLFIINSYRYIKQLTCLESPSPDSQE